MNQQIEQCGRCGRLLKSNKSKKDGFGPICLQKFKAEKALAESKPRAAETSEIEEMLDRKYGEAHGC